MHNNIFVSCVSRCACVLSAHGFRPKDVRVCTNKPGLSGYQTLARAPAFRVLPCARGARNWRSIQKFLHCEEVYHLILEVSPPFRGSRTLNVHRKRKISVTFLQGTVFFNKTLNMSVCACMWVGACVILVKENSNFKTTMMMKVKIGRQLTHGLKSKFKVHGETSGVKHQIKDNHFLLFS